MDGLSDNGDEERKGDDDDDGKESVTLYDFRDSIPISTDRSVMGRDSKKPQNMTPQKKSYFKEEGESLRLVKEDSIEEPPNV